MSGSLISYQDAHVRTEQDITHVLDVHWRINNAQVFAHALTHEGAAAHAVAVRIDNYGTMSWSLLPDGRLVVTDEAGATHRFAVGDVVHVRPAG